MLRSIEVVNAAISVDRCSWRALARSRLRDHRAVELLVVAHGVLEHADRARQRADLVAARAVGNGDRAALGDLFGHARDLGERTDHGAPDDQRPDRGEQDRERAEHAHQPGGEVDAGVDLGVGLARLLGIERAKHVEVLVQRRCGRCGWRRCRPIRGRRPWPTSVPSRASSLRNSMNCRMRSANGLNCAACSGRTDALPAVDDLEDLIVELAAARRRISSPSAGPTTCRCRAIPSPPRRSGR